MHVKLFNRHTLYYSIWYNVYKIGNCGKSNLYMLYQEHIDQACLWIKLFCTPKSMCDALSLSFIDICYIHWKKFHYKVVFSDLLCYIQSHRCSENPHESINIYKTHCTLTQCDIKISQTTDRPITSFTFPSFERHEIGSFSEVYLPRVISRENEVLSPEI